MGRGRRDRRGGFSPTAAARAAETGGPSDHPTAAAAESGGCKPNHDPTGADGPAHCVHADCCGPGCTTRRGSSTHNLATSSKP